MCGIFGVVDQQNTAAQTVLDGLKKLEYRGYDSWGITVKKGEKLVRERHVGKIGQANTSLPFSHIGLGHTRWATHGGVTVGNAHPHLDCSKTLCLVHNGIVENFLSLKQSLKDKHTFSSETDTEVALHLIEEIYRHQSLKQSVLTAFKQIHGMNAFIVLDAKTDQLVAVKNGSPLAIGLSTTANYIASDVWALLHHTNKVIFLEDNQLAVIDSQKVIIFDVTTGRRLKPKINRLNWQAEQSQLGKFHHYMEKEIYDQPKVIDNLARLEPKTINNVANSLQQACKIYLLGCGTAAYAALFGEYLLKMVNRLPVEAVVGSEFKKNQGLLQKHEAFLILSQSGETIDVVEAVNLALKQQLTVIALTNVLGSTLYRKAHKRLLLQAGQEVAVASTKAFIAKLAVLLQLSSAINHQLLPAKKLITKAGQSIAKVLKLHYRRQIKALAKTIKDQEHAFVIGKLQSFPLALEAALKIKEVSYVHAEGYAAGELKHGPIALIEQGTPCIILAPNDDTYSDVISAAFEMKARGGLIIGISPKKHSVFDVFLTVDDLGLATSLPMIVVAQLLAYDLAITRGLNPDKPRNLAKSVTVK